MKIRTSAIHPNAKALGFFASKDKANQTITHRELRRAYKLCNDSNINPEIRKIAKRSFKFVKVEKNRSRE